MYRYTHILKFLRSINCRTIKKKISTKSKHDMYFDIFEFARNLSCKKNIKEWPFGFIWLEVLDFIGSLCFYFISESVSKHYQYATPATGVSGQYSMFFYLFVFHKVCILRFIFFVRQHRSPNSVHFNARDICSI